MNERTDDSPLARFRDERPGLYHVGQGLFVMGAIAVVVAFPVYALVSARLLPDLPELPGWAKWLRLAVLAVVVVLAVLGGLEKHRRRDQRDPGGETPT